MTDRRFALSSHPRIPARRRRIPRGRRAGMTLVELSISMLVLVVAVGATLGSISSATGLEESNRQTVEAFVAARRMIETL